MLEECKGTYKRDLTIKFYFRNYPKYECPGLQPANFSKKSLRRRCFPMNLIKYFRTLFFAEHLPMTATAVTGMRCMPSKIIMFAVLKLVFSLCVD